MDEKLIERLKLLFDDIIHVSEEWGVTEQLKAENQMEWLE